MGNLFWELGVWQRKKLVGFSLVMCGKKNAHSSLAWLNTIKQKKNKNFCLSIYYTSAIQTNNFPGWYMGMQGKGLLPF